MAALGSAHTLRCGTRAARSRTAAAVPHTGRRRDYAAMAALPGMESLVPNVQAILLLDGRPPRPSQVL